MIRIEGLENSSKEVSPLLSAIKLFFSKPLQVNKGISFNYGDGGKEHYPLSKNIQLSVDGYSITIGLQLKPDYDYSFVITGQSFISIDDFPLVNYKINFKTSSQ